MIITVQLVLSLLGAGIWFLISSIIALVVGAVAAAIGGVVAAQRYPVNGRIP